MLNGLHPLLLNIFVAELFAGSEHRGCASNRRGIHNGRLDLDFGDVVFMSGVGAENLIHLLKGFPPGSVVRQHEKDSRNTITHIGSGQKNHTQIPESKANTPKKRNVPYLIF